MAKEHKPHKEEGHWPYLAIVALVAVVAVVFLAIKDGETTKSSDDTRSSEVSDKIDLYDDEGTLVGAARWSGGRYRQTIKVVRSGEGKGGVVSSDCKDCGGGCSVCGDDHNPYGVPDCCNYCGKGCSTQYAKQGLE